MQDLVTRYLRKFKKEHRMRRRLGGVLLVLALMVSIGVYWQLKLTGAALTNETYCGKEEHTHDSEECYEWVLVCGYDDVTESEVTVEELEELWEAGLIGTEDASAEVVETAASETVTVTDAAETETSSTNADVTDEAAETGASTEVGSSEESAAEAVSTAAEVSDGSVSTGHTHTAECYETVTTLVCDQEESETVTVTTEGHTHDDACYTAVLTCGQEEGEGHTHSESCYETELVLTCGLEESEGHTHSEDCYDEEGNLICGLEESEGHTHSDSCYTEVETLVCGLEESEGHTHDESCYTTELTCGLDESETVTETIEGHTHDESCYVTEQVLVCGLEDTEGEPESTEPETADHADDEATTESENNSDNTGDPADDTAENNNNASEEGTSDEDITNSESGHVHTAACYQKVLVCKLEEHTHTAACLSDNTADVETAEDWEASLPDNLSEDWAEAVVEIAKSQLGYTESTANFTLDDDGETQRGYTRYGAWAGNEYGDWDAMFASFCLSYAGLSTEAFPESTGANAWAVKLKDVDLYKDAADYVPTAGDLVFLDSDEDGKIDRVGIVISVDEKNDKLTVIEGNYAVETDTTENGTVDAVCEVEYSLSAACVLGYGVLPEYVSEFKTFTATADGVTVTVTAPTGALPDGAELVVSLIEEGSDAYNAAAEAIGYEEETVEVAATESEDGIALASEEDAETETETVATSGLAVLDISFQVDGVEVEPTEAVTVSIDASAIIPEEADASTIEVQHLTETEDGVVESTVVADATEETAGTVTVSVEEVTETTVAVAEFEVESFSKFTITWSNNNGSKTYYTIKVIYVDETGNELQLDEECDSVTIQNNSSNYSSDKYYFSTYAYSINGYEYSKAVYGSVSDGSVNGDEVTYVIFTAKNSSGQTSRTVTFYNDGEQVGNSINNSSTDINVYLIYVPLAPSVSISAEGSDANGYTLTATPSYFSGDPSYSWEITSSSDNAAITTNSDGTAEVAWSDEATDGDTVTVQVTATYTDKNGNEEIATSTYTLTYGKVELTVYVTYNGGTAASGATVTLKTEDGTEVSSGTTDADGKITFTVSNATTYTISASYKVSSSATLTNSKTVLVSESTEETIELVSEKANNSASTSSADHIDIKYSAAESEETEGEKLTSINSVYVYNSSGTLLYGAYDTDSIKENNNGNEWQLYFHSYNSSTSSWNNGTSHSSLSIQSTYKIVITYTVTLTDGTTKQYTATIDSTSTYADGTYYPADGANAYVLYNYLYGTSYGSNEALKNAGIEKIDISGMKIFLVAGILCDANQSGGYGTYSLMGLDFALSVGSLKKLSANWDFEVQKTFKSSSMSAGAFTFTLSGASVTTTGSGSEVWTESDTLQSLTNSAANQNTSGDSTDTISFAQITYSTSDAGTYYYVVKESKGSTAGVTYDGTVYGVKVVVTVTASTNNAVTTQTTNVTATYYKLVWSEENNGYVVSVEFTPSTNSDSLPVFTFTNSYASSADFTILKVDEDSATTDSESGETSYSTTLSGAKFILTQSTTNTTTDEITTTYYKEDGSALSTSYEMTSGSDGKISVTGLSDGTYTLTEVTAPDGYNLLTSSITVTVAGGNVTAIYNGKSIVSTDTDGSYVITVTNKAGYELPSTGGTGTMPYTLLGLLLCGGAALLYCSRRRQV
ncbi:MAG: LPXTG cell wall anchor domain-containing protein [Lachnospiraceae bacterium]|nr:LPXTG cell wall anchor domain-containing protein [Lachnospiraceae bacterium]